MTQIAGKVHRAVRDERRRTILSEKAAKEFHSDVVGKEWKSH
jgi:hypothetical protein